MDDNDVALAFHRALTITLGIEGGYSNRPTDRGGPTMWGITQHTYTAWLVAHGRPDADVASMRAADRDEIYRTEYWYPSHAHEIPSVSLACCHFDAFVNHRPTVAFRFLQVATDAPVDGVWGAVTKAAVENALAKDGEQIVVNAYLQARGAFYSSLVARDPTQHEYLRGWSNRLKTLAAAFGLRGTRQWTALA